jgi:hypothetical protein
MGEGWVPEFEGQRPPFTSDHPAIAQQGNERALQHGAHSSRKVMPLARELLDVLLSAPSTPGWVKAPEHRLELLALCRADAQVHLLTEWLASRAEEAEDDVDRAGVGDLADERVKSAYLLLHRAEARAASARTRLGLTPVSRARLGKDVAVAGAADAAAALTRMREEHDRAEAERNGEGS